MDIEHILSEQNILTLKDKAFDLLYFLGRYIFRGKYTPILLYHSIDDSGSIVSVNSSEFKKQMKFLKNNGFRTISLDDYISCINENRPAPAKSFVLTFDDGYLNFISQVLPVLKKYGFCATIFLTTGYIEGSCEWIEEDSVPRLKMLGWKEIIQLKNTGISFGAHTVNHPHMTQLTDNDIKYEILECKKLMEQRLENPITSFCYPYGDYDERVLNIVRKMGFRAACSVEWGVKNDLRSLFALKRVTIGPETTLSYLKFIFSGFYDMNLTRKRLFKSRIYDAEKKD
ncbi:MAG: polysaccharide deacetylase family protein [bacterium]